MGGGGVGGELAIGQTYQLLFCLPGSQKNNDKKQREYMLCVM